MTIPEDALGGVYANFLTVWHTAHEFTLDFAATLPAEQRVQEDGSPEVVMTQFEERFGAITRPGEDEPIFPPDDLLGGSPE